MPTSRNFSFVPSSSFIDMSTVPPTNNSSGISVPEGCLVTGSFAFVPWDNEDNIVSKQVDDVIKIVFNGISLPLLFLVSLGTNIINLVVFYKLGLKERINACLFTLSLVDLLSLSVTFGYNSDMLYMFIIGNNVDAGPSVQFYSRYFLTGLNGLTMSSQMVYAVIALERCLCITKPLLVKNLMPTRTIVIALWTMTISITGGYIIVCGARYSVVCVFNPIDNSVAKVSYPTDLYFRHQVIFDIMYGYVYGLLFPGISFICVVVCTIVTAIKLKQLSKWRESVSTASGAVTSRDVAITRVIIGTSLLFIACILPAIVTRSSSIILPELKVGGRHDNMAWVLIRLYLFASAINSTFNFFIYYACGSKFRETTRRLFSCCSSDTNKTKTTTCKTIDKF